MGPSVASAHNESRYWGYCSVFNALDFSTGVLPASTVKDTDTWERYPRASSKPLSDFDAWYERLYGKGTEGPAKYRDAPISLQIVSRRFQEEKLLAVMERVDEVLRDGIKSSAQQDSSEELQQLSSQIGIQTALPHRNEGPSPKSML